MNVKIINHILCNCVCVLLRFNKNITLINGSNVASERCEMVQGFNFKVGLTERYAYSQITPHGMENLMWKMIRAVLYMH